MALQGYLTKDPLSPAAARLPMTCAQLAEFHLFFQQCIEKTKGDAINLITALGFIDINAYY